MAIPGESLLGLRRTFVIKESPSLPLSLSLSVSGRVAGNGARWEYGIHVEGFPWVFAVRTARVATGPASHPIVADRVFG